MRSFMLLLKIQMLGLFGINKTLHADPRKAKRMIALGVLAVATIVLVAGTYSTMVATGLVQLGMTESIPLVAICAGSLIGAVAAFMKANGMLFAFKDFDMVMSLPVPVLSVVLSRIASLYAMSVGMSILAMVPAFVVYSSTEGVSVVGAVCIIFAILLAPLLPLAVAVVLAALIAVVSSRFKHANIVMVVLMLGATMAALVGSFALSSQSGDMSALSALSSDALSGMAVAFPPAAWATEGIVQGNLIAFAAFAAVSLAAFALLTLVLVRVFVPVNEALMSSRPSGLFSFEGPMATASDAHPHKGMHVRTPFRALLVKEARMLASTPIYLLNACMGYLLIIIGALAAAVAHLLGMMPLDLLPEDYASIVGGFLPWVLAFCAAISSTTAPSVSLEGSNRWLMLSVPVSTRTVLGAKAMLNLTLAVPTILMSAMLLSFAFSLDAFTMAAMFVVPLAFALFSTFVGLFMDARHPRYDWTTVYEPVKRGIPVLVVILGGMVLIAVGVVLSLVGGMGVSLIFSAVVGAGSVLLWRATVNKGLVA